MFSIGVFAIIFDSQQRVLLCHRRDRDIWNLPGGGLESGEAPWEGVVREVLEETGLCVKVEKLQGIYSKPDKDDIVFSFICTRKAGKLKLTDEADQLEYFSIDAIPSNTLARQVERIYDAMQSPDGITLKSQPPIEQS
jgi:ADP-ribose pyrophosphatase YjhB (NUDIX family)